VVEKHFLTFAGPTFKNGYSIISLLPGQKKPRPGLEWQDACWSRASPDWIHRHATDAPDSGVGLACGKYTVAFDLDVDNEDAIGALRGMVEGVCGKTPLLRVGREPRVALVYRSLEPIVSIRLPKVDVLGLGTQLVAYGTHPHTRGEYRWVGGTAPHLTGLGEIPGVTNAQCEAVAEVIMRAVCGERFERMVFSVDHGMFALGFASRSRLSRQLLIRLFGGKAKARRRIMDDVIGQRIPPGNWGFIMQPEVKGGMDYADIAGKMARCEFAAGPEATP
jgi:hypothetical protein